MLGYWIGHPFARSGYTSASVKLVLDFAFADLGLHRVEAATLPHNTASRRLLQKLGFNEEGRVRSYLCINGKWQDHMLYSMICDDWDLQRPAAHHPGTPG